MPCLHQRGAGRRSSGLRRHVPATAAFFASLAVAGPAFADSEFAEISSINLPAATVVTSDGTKYLNIAGPAVNIGGEITVELDVGVAGRIHSFKAWPRIEPPAGSLVQALDYKEYGYSEAYSRPRPKVVEKKFTFSIPAQAYEGFVVAGCNYEADRLRAQGLSNSEIFAEERAFELKFSARLEAEMSGPKPVNPVPQQLQFSRVWNVVCLQSTIVASNLSAETTQVNSGSGKCELQLSGSIMSNQPHTKVKFFYVAADGQKSDLKAVTTGANSKAAFEHSFPNNQGVEGAQIRIVGESHDFQSDWVSFKSDCVAPAQDVMTVLPPKAVSVEAIATGEDVMHRGLICPAKVKIYGVIKGRGTADGYVVLAAGGAPKALEPYNIVDGKTIIVEGEHVLTWGPTQAQQSVTFATRVFNKKEVEVDRVEATQNFVCREPEALGDAQGAAGDFGSTAPESPDLSLSLAATGQKVVGSFVCPATLFAEAKVKANDAMDLRVIHFLEQPNITIGQSSQAKEQTFSFMENQHETFPESFALNWQGLSVAAGQPLQQPVKMTVRLAKDGFVMAEQEKTLVVTCEGSVAGGLAGPGQQTAGADAPQARPGGSAIGRLVTQQAQAFAIQAPKGLVHKGEIRLAGGAVSGSYTLKFFRKNGGAYMAVNAAQLPKQMTGLAASFPLKALTGGRDWRLEVCPAKQSQAACKTADFRLPRIGAISGAKTPAGKPATPVFLVPGAVQ